ncbi:MAG: hypothetical protein QXN66_06865 [Thermoplasmatales archaeon]
MKVTVKGEDELGGERENLIEDECEDGRKRGWKEYKEAQSVRIIRLHHDLSVE